MKEEEDPLRECEIAHTGLTFVGKDGHVLIHITIEGLFDKVVVLKAGEMEDLIIMADAAVQASRLTPEEVAVMKEKNIKEMN